MNTMWNTLRIYNTHNNTEQLFFFPLPLFFYRSTVQALPKENFYGYTGSSTILFPILCFKVNTQVSD